MGREPSCGTGAARLTRGRHPGRGAVYERRGKAGVELQAWLGSARRRGEQTNSDLCFQTRKPSRHDLKGTRFISLMFKYALPSPSAFDMLLCSNAAALQEVADCVR
jgi:hypothetical protein